MSNNYTGHPKTERFIKFQELENVRYGLVAEDMIRDFVLEVANEEWDPEDFGLFGEDLKKSIWKLEEVKVDAIKTRDDLMNDPDFIKSLDLRIIRHINVHNQKIAIPPLILRGSDLLIFDGYARTHTFKQLGIKKALAYVGRN